MYIRLSFANEDFCSKLSEPQRRFALRIQHFSENSYSIPKYAELLMTQPLLCMGVGKQVGILGDGENAVGM